MPCLASGLSASTMGEPVREPLISVILVSYNSCDWFPRCLESLRTQTIFARTEILIVDNASTDGSEQKAREITRDWSNVQVVQTGRNEGFCANNRGAEIARGKYLFIVNPDTWMEPDCLEKLYATAERERAAVVAATILEYEDNSVQAEGGTGFDFCGNWVTSTGRERPKELICPSNFWFISREVYRRVGMLDEEYFMYGEEMDLGWRVWISGERIIPELEARIHHRGAASVNPAGGTRVVEHRTSIQKRFYTNRNHLLFVAADCHSILLIMLLPSVVLIVFEGLATMAATRSWQVAWQSCFRAFSDFWRLRGHIQGQRKQNARFRKHGDFWMLRFFKFKFGRWTEMAGILRRGFPRIK